ncbi:4-coumarate-CoA ligase 2 [Pyricularia oryzae Y34]|uniref:4-coumarate-CoA ligase 2 n=2 Tax=Pyricularia oryzae TaxID=318829 RepID=A0AA97NZ46_PYRO3|nr:4-coumarate-CoA ligase 2 [Pyricularia oryzae Y34]
MSFRRLANDATAESAIGSFTHLRPATPFDDEVQTINRAMTLLLDGSSPHEVLLERSSASAAAGDAAQSNNAFSLSREHAYTPRRMRVITIGAGFSGLLMAHKFQHRFPELRDAVQHTIFEALPDVGGTWLVNQYPGLRCDVPAHIYAFPFDPKPDWDRVYATGEDIRGYIMATVRKWGLDENLHLNSRVVAARWLEQDGQWRVTVSHGGVERDEYCEVLISGQGVLRGQNWPSIPGLADFGGHLVHSASWDLEIDYSGKRIAVIGNGASGVQIVPEMARLPGTTVTNFIRGPTWVYSRALEAAEAAAPATCPDPNPKYTPEDKIRFRDPRAHAEYRKGLVAKANKAFCAMRKGEMNIAAANVATAQMAARLGHDKRLCDILIPKWELGCKRVVPGFGYLESFRESNVHLSNSAIVKITKNAIYTADGQVYDVDIIICATGFDTSHLPRYPIIGQDQTTDLASDWKNSPYNYMSVAVPKYPNFFMQMGPRCLGGQGSLIQCLDWTGDYIARWVAKMASENIKYVAPRDDKTRDFMRYGDSIHSGLVWSGGCASSYKRGTVDGPVTVLFGGGIQLFCRLISEIRAEDFDIVYRSPNPWRFMGDGFLDWEFKEDSDLACCCAILPFSRFVGGSFSTEPAPVPINCQSSLETATNGSNSAESLCQNKLRSQIVDWIRKISTNHRLISRNCNQNNILAVDAYHGLPSATMGARDTQVFPPLFDAKRYCKAPSNTAKCQKARDAPDSIPLEEFMCNEEYGRRPFAKSRNPFTCGLTGRTYTPAELFLRSTHLARALARRTAWGPNDDLTPWDKVVAVFSVNTIDYILPIYATHRLNGIATAANAVYTAGELEHQLRSAGAGVLFTCAQLLDIALQAADAVGMARDRVFLLPTVQGAPETPFPTVEELIDEGRGLAPLEPLRWVSGQGKRQVAFITYSSGTSGLPKAVLISHHNVISNVVAHVAYDSVGRRIHGIETEVELGLVPMSHTYGLLVVSHTATWRGDEVIVLPKFEIKSYLDAIQTFRIQRLLVVPPIIVAMLHRRELCAQYDLSSVRFVFCGAAPLGQETVVRLAREYPAWTVGQAYGMTEAAVIVTNTSEHDVLNGSSGSLLPGTRAKIIDPLTREEITSYNSPGELWIQATAETFVYDSDGRWLRSGDEVCMAISPQGYEHLFVIDRIKELIKVKGQQVAPAELEAHILTHPAVADVAVTQTSDPWAGEVPKAFVVVEAPEYKDLPPGEIENMVVGYVAEHKAPYKWIKGGVEIVDTIPKSPSGKILRRLLRDRERTKAGSEGGKKNANDLGLVNGRQKHLDFPAINLLETVGPRLNSGLNVTQRTPIRKALPKHKLAAAAEELGSLTTVADEFD